MDSARPRRRRYSGIAVLRADRDDEEPRPHGGNLQHPGRVHRSLAAPASSHGPVDHRHGGRHPADEDGDHPAGSGQPVPVEQPAEGGQRPSGEPGRRIAERPRRRDPLRGCQCNQVREAPVRVPRSPCGLGVHGHRAREPCGCKPVLLGDRPERPEQDRDGHPDAFHDGRAASRADRPHHRLGRRRPRSRGPRTDPARGSPAGSDEDQGAVDRGRSGHLAFA